MSRRERMERRLARRQEWAASRDGKAQSALRKADLATEGIPMGQPILVGHHSEGRHRRALERRDNAMGQAFDSMNMAKHHRGKAMGLEMALDRSIFSDDTDALERLDERLAELCAKRERRKAINKAIRAGKGLSLLELTDAEKQDVLNQATYGCRTPPTLDLTNLSANIRRLEQRRPELERQAALRAKVAEALACDES